MELLKERIRRDGKVKGTDVLKVDSFLNHQMDIKLFAEIGREFKRRFADWPDQQDPHHRGFRHRHRLHHGRNISTAR